MSGPCRSIRFEFPGLPPSVNTLYTVRQGRKILCAKGRKYRNAFISARGGADPLEFTRFVADMEGPYTLEIWLYVDMEDLIALNYGRDRRVKFFFQTLDTSNMIKLAEDCVSALTGVPDRNNFDVVAHKRLAGSEGARIVAYLYPSDMKEDPHEAGGHPSRSS